MNIFQNVKEAVTARDAALQYGIPVNRNGMACCPFHNDRHPSMKMDKGFYCFACGEKGDVITFVARLFDLTPLKTAEKLAVDFGIEIEKNEKRKQKHISKAKKSEVSKVQQYNLEKEFDKWERKFSRALSDYLHLLQEWKKYAPQIGDDIWQDKFMETLKMETLINYYLDILLEGTLEERLEFLIDKGEDVLQIEKRLERDKRQYEKNGNRENGDFESRTGGEGIQNVS